MKLKIIKKIVRWYGISQIKKNGFWFVDIPRTSSTSVKEQLAGKYGRTYAKGDMNGFFNDHLTAKRMIEILGNEAWDNLFTFTIVRNPWDRAVSLYNYLLQDVYQKDSSISFKDHILHLKKMYNEDEFAKKKLFKGAYEFISDNNKIVVDKIIRFENREEELKEIAIKLGFDDLGAVHKNETLGEKTYRDYYDKETKEIIEQVYAKDIEEFGYSFE